MNVDEYRRKLLATGRYLVLKGWGIYPKDKGRGPGRSH